MQWILLLLAVLAVARLPEPEPSFRVPFTLRRGHLIVINARIGSLDNLALVLDTGAGRTIIAREVARTLGLHGVRARIDSFGAAAAAEEVTLPDLDIAAVVSLDRRALVLDLTALRASLHLERLDGVLGMDVLRATNFRIDLRAREVVFGAAISLYHHAPLLDDPVFATIETTVNGNRHLRFIVDTGASHTVIFDRPDVTAKTQRLVGPTIHVGGFLSGSMTSLESVQLGSWHSPTVPALIMPASSTSLSIADGLLSLSTLKCGVIQFDFARRKVAWQP